MVRADFLHLDALARRADSPGPVAVLDPLAFNLLSTQQGAGIGASRLYATPTISMYGVANDPYTPNTVSVESMTDIGYPYLTYLHPYWIGFPVTPGTKLTWWTPGLRESGAALNGLRLHWYAADSSYISSTFGATASTPLVATVPANAALVKPNIEFSAVGVWSLGRAVLAAGDVSVDLLSGARPSGEGCPAYSVTNYTHAATSGNGAFRDIGLDMVEVISSATG
ncbi:hypothetical protein [Streptomyces sp. NBC_01506]|uniref:hypothetical protein n=1 Tax=Streptomyces sp. NBC_01506 TaxID=2903887 RepID=UPI00386BE391